MGELWTYIGGTSPVPMRKLPLLLAIGGLLSLASAHAQLAHRYSLTTDGTDSVAGANGTVVGTPTFANGMLTTTNVTGSYVNLPATAGAGITGNFSIELWATQNGSESGPTPAFSLSASTTNFLLFKPNNNGGGVSVNIDQPGLNNSTEFAYYPNGVGTVPSSIFLPFGGQHQIVLTYNSISGVLSVFNNGALVGTPGTYAPGFNLSSALGGVGGINGGDAFNDPSFNGSSNDFRIYSSALTAGQVSALYTAGPDASNATIAADVVPEPSPWMAMLIGAGLLLGMQRFRRSVA